jgi:nucleoside phosphorylase
MKLLVFAHRGEAQAFFNEWELLPVDFFFTGLFKNNTTYLLITGEGPKDASEKTIAVLSSFKNEITEIINIGIAGSLTPKLLIGDICWVRSSYAQNAERSEFKSYTTQNHTNIDCITAFSRITSIEDRKKLSAFADIVDRELWSIASAGHLFKIETSALKLISDDFESIDMCKLVKEEAPALSKNLFHEYQKYEAKLASARPIVLTTHKDSIENYFLNHPKFYFTTSQARKLSTVLRGLFLKSIVNENELKKIAANIIESNANEKTSKELSKIFLNELGEKLNPLNTKIKEKIYQSIKPLIESGATVTFDPELEQEYIQIHYQLRNTKDQKRLMLALEQFSYQKIKDIFKGDLSDDI